MKKYNTLGLVIQMCMYLISFAISYWGFMIDPCLGFFMMGVFMVIHIRNLIHDEPYED